MQWNSDARMKIRKDITFLMEFIKHTNSLGNKLERSDNGGEIFVI